MGVSIWDPHVTYWVAAEDYDGRTAVVRRLGKEPVTVFVGQYAMMRPAPEGYPQPWQSDGYHRLVLTKPNAESYSLWPTTLSD
jgi:hypothetical protein